MSSASDQKLFCEICSGFNCSFHEFVGEKVVSLAYSSAILAPPFYYYFKRLELVVSLSPSSPYPTILFIHFYYMFIVLVNPRIIMSTEKKILPWILKHFCHIVFIN